MTTAVQPSELVFEFASNGMDEINQVQSHQRNHFFKCNSLLLLLIFFFMTRLIGSALAFKPVELSGRPSVFSYMTHCMQSC